ncbi:DUF4865 family protein [Kitasatospora purpeofusca]|uniref:DUF4865 family protein n=1 Tax=Kitasatospora purpeofusca TaxID=67352 RepID=UPI002A5A8728|nr:DUF4865 family protein [Kitasatospora purpeofusca]MDY0810950.1 DUF4865 family protein [Kitasatospora purpeofusca]
MHAMQYEITLPADYDMRTVHRRIATKGSLLDSWPGLGLKAYLVRERGRDGSLVNQYAPFYLWRTPEGMNDFLLGPGFRTLCADFGRPAVRHWIGAGLRRGPADGPAAAGSAEAGPAVPGPVAATRLTERLPEGADPAEAVERALAELPDHPDLHTAAVALDPARWELLRIALWRADAPAEAPGTRYRVHHLSSPELDRLPVGRHW